VAITAPWRVLAIAALVTMAAGVFGMPAAKTLCACGFEDPTSESAAVAQPLTDKFDAGDVIETEQYRKELSDRLVHDRDGVAVRAGGAAMVNVQITEQSQRDLFLMIGSSPPPRS
jgi:putative drug exporter of the RND superfamily